jgi:hypothetical protein
MNITQVPNSQQYIAYSGFRGYNSTQTSCDVERLEFDP